MNRLNDIVLGAAIGAVLVGVSLLRNRATIDNRSDRTVAELTVETPGYRVKFENIQPGQFAQVNFGFRSNTHFTLRGQLSDGPPLTGKFGYVTDGMFGVRATFFVLPDGAVEFSQK